MQFVKLTEEPLIKTSYILFMYVYRFLCIQTHKFK